jgi:hypothetical protein
VSSRLRQAAERAAREVEAAERRRQAEADPRLDRLAANAAERYGLDERCRPAADSSPTMPSTSLTLNLPMPWVCGPT